MDVDNLVCAWSRVNVAELLTHVYDYTLLQIKHCERCQRLKSLMRASTNEQYPIPVKPQVWNLVGMDLIGPFEEDD